MNASYSWARAELQTLATLLDLKQVSLTTAKARAFGYLGLDIKARSANDFIRKLSAEIEKHKS